MVVNRKEVRRVPMPVVKAATTVNPVLAVVRNARLVPIMAALLVVTAARVVVAHRVTQLPARNRP